MDSVIYISYSCPHCNASLGCWYLPERECEHCDKVIGKAIENKVKSEREAFSVMDAYYSSCKTKVETLGGAADKNSKNFGRNFIEEQDYLRKIRKEEGLKKLEEKSGKKVVRKSGKRPWYRPNSDKPISETEAKKIINEVGVNFPAIPTRPGKGVKIKVKRGNDRIKV